MIRRRRRQASDGLTDPQTSLGARQISMRVRREQDRWLSS